MHAQGLMGITLPEADGGVGGSLMDAVIASRRLPPPARAQPTVVQFGNFRPDPCVWRNTPRRRRRSAAQAAPGRRHGDQPRMSEPDAGSAVTDLVTSARQDGAHYIVNGSKVFSTFSPDAEIFLVYLRYGPGLGGIGSVIVERGAPGFTIGCHRAS